MTNGGCASRSDLPRMGIRPRPRLKKYCLGLATKSLPEPAPVEPPVALSDRRGSLFLLTTKQLEVDPNDVRDAQTHPKQCRASGSPRARAAATASRVSSERAPAPQAARIARARRLSPAHSPRVQAVTAIGCRKDRDSDWCSDACRERASPAGSAPRLPVMQASDEPSSQLPLGQRREFIPCRRLAVHLRGRRP
jgi:hypothetical protein